MKKDPKKITVPQYDHMKIEPKWQKFWDKNPKFSQAIDNDAKREKKYVLVEFPFPSGAGLHAGHVRSYTALDIIARKNRMQGKNVLYPIGWDAFGLPTENYAIKTGVHPSISTKQNTKNFTRQLKAMGFSFDWSRIVDTTDPAYYKWTQWIFLQFLKKGLAYRDKISINWCPKDKIGLANEEVIAGCCERCGTKVEKREKEQWMLAITKYADRLDKDLDDVDYPERVKIQQRNWIGKSEGAEIDFAIDGFENDFAKKIIAFTTRADTLFGVTYVVLAPELKLVEMLRPQIKNWNEVEAYRKKAAAADDTERTSADKEKSGVPLEGVFAIHPATKEKLPVWIADYVLATYGTGAVMAVPAHDERDFKFAKKYKLPIKTVIDSEKNTLIESSKFDGMHIDVAKQLITKAVDGRMVTKYKLRDWVFSRQRYWGEPIPVVHCASCGIVPLPESSLPLVLPKVKKYEPTDNGESPLAAISSWVNTKCPKCKGAAKRETDTMPNWAGSSWYYLRYMDPKNKKAFADPKKLKFWGQVDWYNGGMEHTTLHLLYSRFWHKFLFDQGLVPIKEPYAKRTSHGLIMADDGTKMSKSKGNVINPDDLIKTYGADTLRLFEMFIGPFDQAVAWNSDGLIGPRRFIERVFKLTAKYSKTGEMSKEGLSLLHKTIQKVSVDIEALNMNTAVSSLMILSNQLEKEAIVPKAEFEMFLALLAPFVPHVAEEMNMLLGNKKSVSQISWPKPDLTKLVEDSVSITVQVNGKFRGTIVAMSDESKNEYKMTEEAMKIPAVQEKLKGLTIRKTIFIPSRVVNFVAN
jgi:leucyl-tRNA synthetase